MTSEKPERLEKVKQTHNASLERTQKDPTPKKIVTTPTDDSMKKKKKRKRRDSIPHTVTTTTTHMDMETMVATDTAPPTINLQVPVMIELTPDMSINSSNQPTITTLTTSTLSTNLPLQTVTELSQVVKSNFIPLMPTEYPIVQVLSLNTPNTEILEVLDPNTINMDEDILEINIDTMKNISFERSEEPIVFSRDEELEKQMKTFYCSTTSSSRTN